MAGFGMWNKILGKIGNRAGAAVGTATGAVQLIKANAEKKRAMDSTPEMVDPNQAAFLSELQQKRNALNTGSEYTSSLDAVNDKMAQTQDVLAGNSGGDAGGTIAALLKSQQVANQGQGQILAQGQQSENAYNGLYNNLLDKMTQRKLELGLLDRAQNLAEWAQNKQAGAANFLGGIQSFMDWNGGDKKATNPAANSGVADSGQAGQSIANAPGNLRQGVGGFNLGTQNQNLGGSAPNMGATNPLGNAMANNSAKNGVNLSSLRSAPNISGGSGGGGFDFSKLLSGFGK